MQKTVGVICVVLGILILVKGHDVGTSWASQVKQIVVGAPVEKAMQLYLVGIVMVLFGLLLIFWRGK